MRTPLRAKRRSNKKSSPFSSDDFKDSVMNCGYALLEEGKMSEGKVAIFRRDGTPEKSQGG